jgi:hypothetical protein
MGLENTRDDRQSLGDLNQCSSLSLCILKCLWATAHEIVIIKDRVCVMNLIISIDHKKLLLS